MTTCGTWNLWWAVHWIQLRAAPMSRGWGNIAQGSNAMVSSSVHDCRMTWVMRKTGSLVHTLFAQGCPGSQHRTLNTRHPLALPCIQLTGCWVSAGESQFWKFCADESQVWNSWTPYRTNIVILHTFWQDCKFNPNCKGRPWLARSWPGSSQVLRTSWWLLLF